MFFNRKIATQVLSKSGQKCLTDVRKNLFDLTVGCLGPTGNLQWEKEVKEMAGNARTLRMMSWIRWTQALTQMPQEVAGTSLINDFIIFFFSLSSVEL